MSRVKGNSQWSLTLIFFMASKSNSKRLRWRMRILGSWLMQRRFRAATFWLASSQKYLLSPSRVSPSTKRSRLSRMLFLCLTSRGMVKKPSSLWLLKLSESPPYCLSPTLTTSLHTISLTIFPPKHSLSSSSLPVPARPLSSLSKRMLKYSSTSIWRVTLSGSPAVSCALQKLAVSYDCLRLSWTNPNRLWSSLISTRSSPSWGTSALRTPLLKSGTW
mmetsp:Transcript_21320/g.53517  ORF Transcript_21320/g.53517 Transcript_21320/m.53517 type:complete len:218 (-) Transcript_21320:87-740(-)